MLYMVHMTKRASLYGPRDQTSSRLFGPHAPTAPLHRGVALARHVRYPPRPQARWGCVQVECGCPTSAWYKLNAVESAWFQPLNL
jgi:hypothetical protein